MQTETKKLTAEVRGGALVFCYDGRPFAAPIDSFTAKEAEEIARRVNVHEPMLDALRGVLPFIEEDFPEGWPDAFPVSHPYATAYKAILDAIAKAEGRDA